MLADLPTAAAVTSGTVTNAQQKLNFTALLNFLLGHLGSKFGIGPQTVASAATLDLEAVTETRDLVISGTVAITAVTVEAGKVFRCRASGAFTLTNNANIVTQFGANIICAAGDTFTLRATAANTVEVLFYAPVNGSRMLLVASQATTSGSSINFTNIPPWAKKITAMPVGVSANGTAFIQAQIGDSGGLETTGYVSRGAGWGGSGSPSTSGFLLVDAPTAAVAYSGQIIFTLQDAATNTWVTTGMLVAAGAVGTQSVGAKSLSATLDRISLVSTDTFDAGSISILIEG